MSKRFCPTEQWDKEWFMMLSPAHKCLWKYLNDRCDSAGVWSVNRPLAELHIGAKFDWDEVLVIFGDRIRILDEKRWLLPDFARFQYGKLSRGCPAHKPVFAKIEQHGLQDCDFDQKGTDTLLNTLFNRVQEKEKEKEKEKEIEKGGVQGGNSIPQTRPTEHPDVTAVLDLWTELLGPDATRTEARIWVARRLGLARQGRQPVQIYDRQTLERAVRRYAEAVSDNKKSDFTYAVRNFFGSKSYCDHFAASDYQPPAPSGMIRDENGTLSYAL